MAVSKAIREEEGIIFAPTAFVDHNDRKAGSHQTIIASRVHSVPVPVEIALCLQDNTDDDILARFRELPSASAKTESINEIAQVYLRNTGILLRYRCLIVLAKLISVLNDDHAGGGAPHHVYAHLGEVFGTYPSDAVGLVTLLRAEAANQLRALIESKLTHRVLISSLQITKSLVRLGLPVRLDLGMGGVSDIPPYCFEHHGTCVNVPVLLNGQHPISVTAQTISQPYFHLVSKDLGVELVVTDWSALGRPPRPLRFHCAVLSYFRAQVPDFDTFEHVYARLGTGIRIETDSRLPPGTGLGVSSLLSSGVLGVLTTMFGFPLNSSDLVSASVYLEWATGIGGGWEDATALVPGVKFLETTPERPFSPCATPVNLDDAGLRRLQEHLLLINTGVVRQDDSFISDLMDRYCLRDPDTLRCVGQITELNRRLPAHLEACDLEAIGQTMSEQWRDWRRCSNDRCTNAIINELFSELEPFVHGVRMNGIGQGGCAMLILRQAAYRAHVQQIVHAVLGPSALWYDWQPVLRGGSGAIECGQRA